MLPRAELLRQHIPAVVVATLIPLIFVPLFPAVMFHWDEIQLAYGVDDFELTRHRPHPPGYLVFVMLGRAFSTLSGSSAEIALRTVSVVALMGWVGMVAAAMPRSRTRAEQWAWTAPVLAVAVLSPWIHLFGIVGLTYAAEGAAWTALLLAIRKHPAGCALWGLVFAAGLLGGLRQTLFLWAVIAIGIEMLRNRGWITWRQLPSLTAAALLGLATWVVPLLAMTGGLAAYRRISEPLLVGNIWNKSIVWMSPSEAWDARLSVMAGDLIEGAGVFVFFAIAVAGLRAAKGRNSSSLGKHLRSLDPLLIGALLAYFFYTVLIYDSVGYMLSCLMPLLAYALLGTAEIATVQEPPRHRWSLWGCTLLAALAIPWLPAPESAQGSHTSLFRRVGFDMYAHNDAAVASRIDAIRAHFDPNRTVLVASNEYWDWSLRHAGHYLPEFTTLQLADDPFIVITDSAKPYLATRDQTLWAVGPGRFELEELLADPARGLEHIVYLQPVENPKGFDRRVDIRAFVGDSCGPYIETFPTQPGERLASIPAGDIRIAVSARRLLCAPR